MKLQSLFRRKEKLTNHLVINAEAHQGLIAACWHCPHGHAAVRARLVDDLLRSEKQPSENIWIVLFKYLERPDTAAAIQSWQGRDCL